MDSPTYKPGLYACITTSLLNLFIVAALTLTYYRENSKADRGEKELETHEVRVVFFLTLNLSIEK